jgi:hypothetical protein
MKEEVSDLNCGQENELMSFLYGELSNGKKDNFQRHLLECAPCRAEVEGLDQVRNSVVSWRNESLGWITPSLGIADSHVSMVGQPRPSAVAALRQFFDLSPLWLKGAVAFASLLFCLFAGLAVTRLRETPPAPVAANTKSSEYSPEIKAMIDQRVQEELRRIEGPQQTPSSPPIVGSAPVQRKNVQTVQRSTEVAREFPAQRARRPLTKTEREQLATDLRLVAARSESDFDFLDDQINQ